MAGNGGLKFLVMRKSPFAMRRFLILPCLLIMNTLFVGCHKSNINHAIELNFSRNIWLDFKKSVGNNYRYEVTASTWIGYSWKTDITVEGGKVTQRHYKLTPLPDDSLNIPANRVEWTENANEIGSHTQSSAAQPLTMDQIYDKARTDWLVRRENTMVYYETKNRGMLSLCGYSPVNCADDCFVGINIAFIQPL
jgi:hypothetical protein